MEYLKTQGDAVLKDQPEAAVSLETVSAEQKSNPGEAASAEMNLIPSTTYAVFRKCTPDWTLPRFQMPNYDLSYVIEGHGRYTINGTTYIAGSGDLFCSHPGSIREGKTSPDKLMKIYAVDFHLKDFNGEDVNLPISVKTHIGLHKDIIRMFNDLIDVWSQKPSGYTIKTHGILLLILHRIYEICIFNNEEKIDDHRISKVIRYIDGNYHKKINVDALAAMIRLEPHYFNTLFKQKTGVSLHQYMIKTRIKNAYGLLQKGIHSTEDIARMCGYTDIYHFYKQFKTVMGIPPSNVYRDDQ